MRPLILTTLFAPTLAMAAPTVTVDGDGVIRGTVMLDADEATVEALLADSASLAAASPDVRRATATPAGGCERIDLEVKGLFSPFHVQTLRCPTEGGWEETLTDSRVFTAWDATWSYTAEADGRIRVRCAVRTDLTLPVPTSMLQQRTARSVAASLQVLADLATARADPPTPSAEPTPDLS